MYNLTFTIPKWLLNVPPGEYSLKELVRLTGASRHNIYMRLETLGVVKAHKRIDIFWMNIYTWEGAEFYLEKGFKTSINQVRKQLQKGNI